MLKHKKVLFFGLGMWIILMVGTFLFDQFSIDSCLDAGGSFNYSKFECDMASNHPSKSYMQARLGRFIGITVSLVVWYMFTLLFDILLSKRSGE